MKKIYIAIIGDGVYEAISFDDNKVISFIEQSSEQEVNQWIEDYKKEYEVEVLHYSVGISKGYKSCINRYGGKFYMKDKIIELFPEHIVYIEPYGGAGHVIFRKSPSLAEVYNDKDKNLVDFFKMIQNEELRQMLKSQLIMNTTDECEEEFKKSQIILPTDDDTVRIRKYYVKTMLSRNSLGKNYSKSKHMRGGRPQKVNQFRNHVDINMDLSGERLQGVIIENSDAIELIEKFDCKDTFFYLDPPYVHSTRVTKDAYEYEMSDNLHERLVDVILTVEGKVLLSGYDNEIYDRLIENGWKKQKLGDFVKWGSSSEIKSQGEEYVWFNYDLGTGLRL